MSRRLLCAAFLAVGLAGIGARADASTLPPSVVSMAKILDLDYLDRCIDAAHLDDHVWTPASLEQAVRESTGCTWYAYSWFIGWMAAVNQVRFLPDDASWQQAEQSWFANLAWPDYGDRLLATSRLFHVRFRVPV